MPYHRSPFSVRLAVPLLPVALAFLITPTRSCPRLPLPSLASVVCMPHRPNCQDVLPDGVDSTDLDKVPGPDPNPDPHFPLTLTLTLTLTFYLTLIVTLILTVPNSHAQNKYAICNRNRNPNPDPNPDPNPNPNPNPDSAPNPVSSMTRPVTLTSI